MPQKPPSRPIDVRAPRFVGGYTFVLAVIVLLVALLRPLEESITARLAGPEFLLLIVLWASFGAGTVFGNGAHPFAAVFRTVIRPHLGPADVEDPRPPRFALLVGFVISTIGLVLHAAGVPFGLAVAAAFIVIASFLQAFVGFCLGCQVYLVLIRAGFIRPKTPIAT
ncbi:uncharacterized protein DUF4395 [Labedella gwakjiensis]|uniref:DUF4395 domain-containing protein n=1 Tax=Labedella gwakjiensis TaxID=390269 RepID=A0A2P8H0B9_9MICO|nr:DUF4395 domain-containing protein [Labedella gwakjiensis]PSL39675.1 uncharacterized protein DUF4395 [Labedella gwakjiensis]RUQ85937.1 DUF4395 domain-containing protein [Labedella gwakjiensis]